MDNRAKASFIIFTCLMFFFLFSCGDGGVDYPEVISPPETEKPEEPEEPVKPDATPKMISFVVEAAHNDITGNIVGGIINSGIPKIILSTQNWVGNIEKLVVTFEATGTVRVGDIEQVSGVTVNDFSKELEYIVAGEDGTEKIYTISLVSPQLSGLSVVKIDTDGRQDITSKDTYINADIKISHPDNFVYNIDKRTEIRGRGNSTWGYPKKPYLFQPFLFLSCFALTSGSYSLVYPYNSLNLSSTTFIQASISSFSSG